MTYVVTQHCVDCKYTDCVTVCPVDAFHDGPHMVYINPDTCVNCDACVPSCPVGAIYSEEALPAKFQSYILMNAEGAKTGAIINEKRDALPTAKTLEELNALDAQGVKPAGF